MLLPLRNAWEPMVPTHGLTVDSLNAHIPRESLHDARKSQTALRISHAVARTACSTEIIFVHYFLPEAKFRDLCVLVLVHCYKRIPESG